MVQSQSQPTPADLPFSNTDLGTIASYNSVFRVPRNLADHLAGIFIPIVQVLREDASFPEQQAT